MKAAISNLAWPHEQDPLVADLLCQLGVGGIEVAPTKVWPAPLETAPSQVAEYRRFWETRGIRIVAAQSLLFGRPDLTLFEDAPTRRRTLEYLAGIIRLGGQLGAGSLVFGSPKNRRIGPLSRDAARAIAVDFFGRLGELAVREGTIVVLEANPPEYGADFITRAEEAIDLVRAVNHAGFRLHLDTACLHLAGDDPLAVIGSAGPLLRHLHVSEPQLAPLDQGTVLAHAAIADALNRTSYPHWISIEMKECQPFVLDSVRQAIEFLQQVYRPCLG